MNNPIFKYCSLLLFTFLFVTCEKESNNPEDVIVEESIYKVSKINLRESEEIAVIKEKISTIQKKIASQTNDRSQENLLNQLVVDVNNATLIESGEYKSYTLIAELPGEESLLNLLLSLQSDGSYKSILIRYNITEDERIALSVDPESVNLQGRVDYLDLENWTPQNWSRNTGGNIYEDAFNQCPSGSCCSVQLISGGNCGCFQIELEIASCDGSGGGGGSNGGNSNGNGSGSDDGGNNGSGSSGGGSGSGNDSSSSGGTGNGDSSDPDCIADSNGNCAGDVTSPVSPADGISIIALMELKNTLEENEFLLVQDDCNQIEQWTSLAQNEASTEIVQKIDSLQALNTDFFETDDWAIQTLEGARGMITNLDYYGVRVNTLPNYPGTNTQMNTDQFLDYIRRDMNSFVTGSSFNPYCEGSASLCQQETTLWESENPVGAIIYINIPTNDGSVICSEYANNYWHFKTLEDINGGNHPVSGTREFGYTIVIEGNSVSYDFYVRGVDRMNSNVLENLDEMFIGDPFSPADELWNSFQSKLNQFLETNEGQGFIQDDEVKRVDWELLQAYLHGNRDIDVFDCN